MYVLWHKLIFRKQTRTCRHWDKIITICFKYWTSCPEKYILFVMKGAQHRYHSCMNNCMEEREGKGKVHVVSDTVI